MGYGYHKGAMKRTGMRPGMLLVDNSVDLPIFTIAVSDCWKVYHGNDANNGYETTMWVW